MTQPTIFSYNIGRHVPLRDLPWSELEREVDKLRAAARTGTFFACAMLSDPLARAILSEHSRRRAE